MKAAAKTLHPFRVVVRGNSDGRRVRRVRTIMAANEGDAMLGVEKHDPKILTGLVDPYVTVLPPLVKQ